MKQRIKQTLFTSLDLSGMNAFYRKKNGKSVTILTYHSVMPYTQRFKDFDYRNCISTKQFDAQLGWLKSKYNIITMHEAMARLSENRLDGNHLVITFDDGFKNNWEYAMPLLIKHNTSAVFYVSTDFIGKENMLWTELVNEIIMFSESMAFSMRLKQDEHLDLTDSAGRENASIKVRTYLKYSPVAELKRVLNDLLKKTGYVSQALNKDATRYQFMSWKQVQEMHDAGMEIGAHTQMHYLLNMLNAQESEQEIVGSKAAIEKNTGLNCNLFSYPNGAAGNFLPPHFKQLKQAGFISAVTQLPGYNNAHTNKYALNRINISHKMSMPIFKSYIAGSNKILS